MPIWKAEQFGDGHVWVGEPARPAPIDDLAGADRRRRCRGQRRPRRPIVSDSPWGRLDRLVELAETLAGAWGARPTHRRRSARSVPSCGSAASTAWIGPAGRWPARSWSATSRVVPIGSPAGILLPFAMALLEYDLPPLELALDVASGAIDLALEAELLRQPAQREAATREARRLIGSAFARIDANRTARLEVLDVLGELPRPWFGSSLQEPAAGSWPGSRRCGSSMPARTSSGSRCRPAAS